MIPLQELRPVADALRKGALSIPDSLPGAQGTAWMECEVNVAATAVAALVFLLLLKDLFTLTAPILGCMVRWRGNIDIEHSVRLSRERNLAAAAALPVLCLLANRFHLYFPGFISSLPAAWQAAATLGAVLGWLLLHKLMHVFLRPARIDQESWKAAERCWSNYFLLMMAVMLPLTGILLACGCPDPAVKVTLWVVCGLSFTVTLVRKWQILASVCNYLTSFLYLCALEIIPAAALVVSAIAL